MVPPNAAFLTVDPEQKVSRTLVENSPMESPTIRMLALSDGRRRDPRDSSIDRAGNMAAPLLFLCDGLAAGRKC